MAEPVLAAVGALDRWAAPSDPPGATVTVQPLAGLAVAAVLARQGQGAALKARISQTYGMDLPDGPRRVVGDGVCAIGTAPGAWLFTAESFDPRWADGLAGALQGLASVADQSDAYAPVAVSGPGASALLAQAIGVDLHPSAFPVGAAAVTTAAHLNLVLWRREADVFDLLPSRSFAGAFWHWLTEIGAETGLRIEATGP